MPTGYTYKIGEGCTFEEFAWGCARGMGALIMMRDEPADAPIPDAFEPSDYYLKRIEETRAGLARLEAMTDAEADMEAATEREAVAHRNAERAREAEDLLAKYTAVLDRVRAWDPPSPDHEGLKRFMIEQVTDSIRHDCEPWEEPSPPRDGATWRRDRFAKLRRDLDYAHQHWAEEKQWTAERNRWLRQLRESIQPPAPAAAR